MSDEANPCVIFGIAGGSGSGKTTVANAVIERFGRERVQVLFQDSYYRDNTGVPMAERRRINYDHPKAFDTKLFVEHIKALSHGRAIACPSYDYTQHTRSSESELLEPAPVLIVEGILVLAIEEVRSLLDMKIFVDTPADLRFIRRLQRDIDERGRDAHSVVKQYLETVRPMHLAFVENSKRHADVVFPEGYTANAFNMLTASIDNLLSPSGLLPASS